MRKRWPTPPDVPTAEAARGLLADATRLHANGRLDEAIEAAWAAAENDEVSLESHYLLGNWLKDAKRWAEAAMAWNSALDSAVSRETRFEILERVVETHEGVGDEKRASELRKSIKAQRATPVDPEKDAAAERAYWGPEDSAKEIRALETHTVWRRRLLRTHQLAPNSTSHPNPLVAGDLLLVGTTHALYALDRQTGAKRWQFVEQPYGHQPRLASNVVIFPTTHTVFGLRLSDGKKLWEWCPYGRKHEWIYSSPVIASDRFFIGDREGKVHALETQTGRALWSFDLGPKFDVNSTATVLGKHVVIANNAGRVVALERSSGKQSWDAKLEKGSIHELLPLGAGLAIETDRIHLLDSDGNLRKKLALTSMVRFRGARESSSLLARDPENGDVHVVEPDGSHKRLMPASKRVRALRYDPALERILEARTDGLGIVDLEGNRILQLRAEELPFRDKPEYSSGMVYAVSDRPLAVFAVRIAP